MSFCYVNKLRMDRLLKFMWVFVVIMPALLAGIITREFFAEETVEVSERQESARKKHRQKKRMSNVVVEGETAYSSSSIMVEREMVAVAETDEESKPECEINYESWVKIFDGLVKLQNEGNKPTQRQVADFKAAFDKLSDEVKLENIPHAQNLFTDVSIDCLTAILFDDKEPEDVLSSIYYDLLNRPEELKMPIIRKLAADKNHPLSEEALDLLVMVDDVAVKN